MEKEALGLIEVVGLAAAIEAADAATKSADVVLVGYELAKGGGMVTVKIRGAVSAVQAAVSSAKESSGRVGRTVSTLVIPRPHGETEVMVKGHVPGERVFAGRPEAPEPATPEPAAPAPEPPAPQPDNPAEDEQAIAVEPNDPAIDGDSCNLCHDPACTRRRGQPHRLCIHFTP